MKKALTGFIAAALFLTSPAFAGDCKAWIRGDYRLDRDAMIWFEKIPPTDRMEKADTKERCVKAAMAFLLTACPKIQTDSGLVVTEQEDGLSVFFPKQGETQFFLNEIILEYLPLLVFNSKLKVTFDGCTYWVSDFIPSIARAEGEGDCGYFDFVFLDTPTFKAGPGMKEAVR